LVGLAAIKLGEEIDIAVPTGNFGNILAAYYAKVMGLPIRKLICASNTNNILTEFLHRGIYDIRKRKLINTPSPSMDIIIASNIERLLYEVTKDPEKVTYWIKQLKDKKIFRVDSTTKDILHRIFYADWVSNESCLSTIKSVYKETGYLMDPHTAVAQAAVALYQQKYGSRSPVIICSTAYFGKFSKDVYMALKGCQDRKIKSEKRAWSDFQILKDITRIVPKVLIPQKLIQLKSKKIRHKTVCGGKKEEIESLIKRILRS
jgi:threonine synthase